MTRIDAKGEWLSLKWITSDPTPAAAPDDSRAGPFDFQAASSRILGRRLLSEPEIVSMAAPARQQSGVYFLIRAGRVIYVGQSKCVPRRVEEHEGSRPGRFDKVAVIWCARAGLDVLESLYIHMLKPEENGTAYNGEKSAPMTLKDLDARVL